MFFNRLKVFLLIMWITDACKHSSFTTSQFHKTHTVKQGTPKTKEMQLNKSIELFETPNFKEVSK